MNFTLLDWSAIILYLGITWRWGFISARARARGVDDYALCPDRNVSWWLAGTSMVATTFAADTPLVVTGLVYTQGIAGELVVVENVPAFRHDDGVSVCPPVAPLRTPD
jgi:Na+/proline symporter